MLVEVGVVMVLRKFIVFTLIIVLTFNNVFLNISAGSTNDIIQQHQLLRDREQQIVAEMINIELKLERSQQELKQVQRKLAETRAELPTAKEQLIESEKLLNVYLDRLKIWLKHLYVEGRTNYLLILFGAVNLGDFLHRLALVGMLISQGIGDVDKAAVFMGQVKDKAKDLAELEQQLTSQEAQVEKMLLLSKKLLTEKEQLLKQTRLELGENQGKVLNVVSGLKEALKPLDTLLDRFRDAPWDKYRPDRLQFTGNRVKAEYNQNTITKLLFGGNGQQSVSASFSDNLFTIKGTTPDRVDFTISGDLSVLRGNVCYKIKSITLGNMPLSKELVESIGGKDGLIYPAEMLMGWQLSNIKIYEGKAVFELVPA